MSGILAVVVPEGQRIAPAVMNRMVEALHLRGDAGVRTWTGDGVAIAHAQLALSPAAGLERQPHADESAGLRVVLDGRFDNRDELAEAFERTRLPLGSGSDSELLLLAYQLWGDDCAERLLGDFAFALWDVRRRRLVCARDVLGIRPLYVCAKDKHVAVASEIAPLCRYPLASREPNEAFLAEVLNGRIVHCTDTVWRDISRVPAGHLLIAEKGRVHTRRYWAPDPSLQLRYRSDDEYGEHLAELIRRAVARRSGRAVPTGVMLSGGIDSSSIVGALHAQRGDRPEPLQTFSIVGPGEPWDETPFVDAVAAMWPIASHRRPASEGSCEYYAAEAAKYQDLPPYPNGVMANGIFEAARSLYGIRVLLTGLWSDEWLGPSGMYAPDLLRSGRFVQLWRHYRAGDTHHHTPASLFRSLVWPLVPPGARQAVKRTLRRDGISPWITPSHAAAVNLADRVGPPPADVRFPTLAKTQSWSSALGGSSMHGIEAESRATSGFGLETRHPFADREIVQFGLAIPEEQRWRGRQRKVALRHAARDWVPAQVHDRPPPVGAASILVRAIERHVSAGLWHNAATGRRGWVDPALLRAAYERMMARYRASDGGYEDSVRPLWMACAAEIFTRRVLDEETQGCSLGGPARS